jgi:hypothetical protein
VGMSKRKGLEKTSCRLRKYLYKQVLNLSNYSEFHLKTLNSEFVPEEINSSYVLIQILHCLHRKKT